jgi:predicted transcriptional regulator
MGEVDWLKYGFVAASEHRKKVIKALAGRPITPKALSMQLRLPMSHVSKTLADLNRNDLVACLTPKLRKGKIFALTRAGEEIAAQLGA